MALVVPSLMEIPVIIVIAGTDIAAVVVFLVAMPAIAGVATHHAGGSRCGGCDKGAGTHKQSDGGGRNSRFQECDFGNLLLEDAVHPLV